MLPRSANLLYHPRRTSTLPLQLRPLIQSRFASTISAGSSSAEDNSVAYPFPKHPRPTPHEIFHLRPGASQRDIKARCTFGYKRLNPLSNNISLCRLRACPHTPSGFTTLSKSTRKYMSFPLSGHYSCVRHTYRKGSSTLVNPHNPQLVWSMG